VVVALESGEVLWYLRGSGRPIGRVSTGARPAAGPVLLPDRRVAFPSMDGRVFQLDARGVRWRAELSPGHRAGPLAVDGAGALYAATADGAVTKLAPDGAIVWRIATPVSIERSPVLAEDGTLLVAAGRHLLAIDPARGAPLWTAPVGGEIVGGPLVAADATVFVSLPAALVAIGPRGALRSRAKLPASPVPGLTLADHHLWVGLRDGTLRRFHVPQAGLARSPWAKSRGDLMNSGTSR
jgi:outer membrane protein assembly factor BamB